MRGNHFSYKQVPELERKINLCKDVSALSTRVWMGLELGTFDNIGTVRNDETFNPITLD